MAWLVLGLTLWIAAHLFKRVQPHRREAMGKAGRGVVAVVALAGLVLMVVGFRAAEVTPLYALPGWVWHLNNLLMLVAVFLMDVGRVGGVVRTRLRHPMLLGVVLWAVAHLLVNGDLASLVLFGTLGLWSVVEMAAINRAEGPWTPPPPGRLSRDGLMAVAAVAVYGAIAGIHYWLGHPVFPGLG